MSNNVLVGNVLVEVSKSIPEKAWVRLANTACNIFESCVSPLTEVGSGIGRLIRAKFDRMAEIEKVLTARAVQNAEKRLLRAGCKMERIKDPKTFLSCMDCVSTETDKNLQHLWSNLLAQEMSGAGVHPEIPRILGRLTAVDAVLLIRIEKNSDDVWRLLSRIENKSYRQHKLATILLERTQNSLNHGVLEALNLIKNEDGKWSVTEFGRSFVKAVSIPSY